MRPEPNRTRGGFAFWKALGFGDYARTLVRRGGAPSAL